MSIVYLDGAFLEEETAAVSPFDRGFLYGDGLFETIKATEGRPWFLEAHLTRLRASCAFLNLPLDAAPGAQGEKCRAVIEDLLAFNALGEVDAAVRMTVTRGRHDGSLDLEGSGKPTLLVTARPYTRPPSRGEGDGLALTICRDLPRNELDPLTAHKSLNYLYFLLVRDRARQGGFDDGIILNRTGAVCECTTSNLFVVEQGRAGATPRVRTPALRCGLLPGVLRAELMRALGEAGLTVDEDEITTEALLEADEVFCTNSLVEIRPVSRIDGRSGYGTDVTRRIAGIFEAHKG